MQFQDAISQISKVTAKYNGQYDVEVLDMSPDGTRCYVCTLNGGQVFGTPGMWGGCESSYGWVPRNLLTEIKALDDQSNVLDIEPNQVEEERAEITPWIHDLLPAEAE